LVLEHKRLPRRGVHFFGSCSAISTQDALPASASFAALCQGQQRSISVASEKLSNVRMTMMAASNATLSNVRGAVIVALSRYRRPAQEKETSCPHAAADSFAPRGEGGRSEFSIRVGGNEVAAGVEQTAA
jgi:hypothetical protein